MNLSETIKNIRATCNNYIDPNLLAFLIDDNDYMKTNNIMEIEGYEITDNDIVYPLGVLEHIELNENNFDSRLLQ